MQFTQQEQYVCRWGGVGVGGVYWCGLGWVGLGEDRLSGGNLH